MAKTAQDVMQLIREQGIKMVDFKMVDINGQYRHVTIPAQNFTEATMTDGIGFDASNYGYAVVEKSDMVFIPDPATAQIDPFCEVSTLSMTGNAMIIDYPHNRPLDQYPRNIVLAAEQYMRDTGIADTMLILPEFEFYLFDDVAWKVAPNEIGMSLDAEQAHWNGDINGRGVIVPRQGHYHIAKPLDRTYECRSEMCLRMEEAGIPIKYHHPEVGGAGQFEIEPKLGEMSKMADATMLIKYIIHNTALKYGKSATFMPKPVYGEAGSGMHVHMLLLKDGEPVFSDDNGYSHLSREAHWFMGGLLKHIHSLCAITNPSTNSFKRLVPGFEAPVTVGYATSNRSAVIGEVEDGLGVLGIDLGSDGSGGKYLFQPAGGSRRPASHETVDAREHFIHMNGNEVFKFAIQIMGKTAKRALAKAGLEPADVDLLVPHQANIRIINSAAKRLKMPMEKVWVNVDKYGNTSAASIPIALCEAQEQGVLKKGGTVLLVGFGAGLTWSSIVLKWSK